MNLDYLTVLSTESQARAVYVAEVDDRKFVSTYSISAHHLLAEKGLAPKVICNGTDGPRYGGLSMIVMEYIKGSTLTQLLLSSPSPERLDAVLGSVRMAIELLHTRRPGNWRSANAKHPYRQGRSCKNHRPVPMGLTNIHLSWVMGLSGRKVSGLTCSSIFLCL
jgi:hypothetical protein